MKGRAVALATPLLPFTGTVEATREASADAARRAEHAAPIQRERVYQVIRQRGAHGATDNELCAVLGLSGSSVRPRRIELLRADRIETDGTKRQGSTVWYAR